MLKHLVVLAAILTLVPQAFAMSAEESNRYKADFKKEMNVACQQGMKKETAGLNISGIDAKISKYCDCASVASIKMMTDQDMEAYRDEKLYGKKQSAAQRQRFYNLGYKAGQSCQESLK